MKKILLFAVIATTMMAASCGTSKKALEAQNQMLMQQMQQSQKNTNYPGYSSNQQATQNGSKKVAKTGSEVSGIKERAAELKAEGWNTAGAANAYTMEEILARHRSYVETELGQKYIELTGIAQGDHKSDDSALKNNATLSAIRELAQKTSAAIRGGETLMGNDFSGSTREKIVTIAQNRFEAALKSYLIESYALNRQTDTHIEWQLYFLVDRETAINIQKDALKVGVDNVITDIALQKTMMNEISGMADNLFKE